MGCACYFKPLTPCGNVSDRSPSTRRISNAGEYGSIVPSTFKDKLLSTIPGMNSNEVWALAGGALRLLPSIQPTTTTNRLLKQRACEL